MNNTLDANIPVLTEIIAPAPAPATATPRPLAKGEAQEAQMAAQWSDKEWEQLEHRLTERVLKQLQGRVEFVLEQRVRDSLADVLQLALVGLTSEIKRGLQQTMEEVIARAVQQEITRLQALKK